jgi:hypothetical protein
MAKIPNWLRKIGRKGPIRITRAGKGIRRLDEGKVAGPGVEKIQRWEQAGTVDIRKPMSTEQARRYFFGLEAVKRNPSLRSRFGQWDTERRRILAAAETEFKKARGILQNVELDHRQVNDLGVEIKKKMDALEKRISSGI